MIARRWFASLVAVVFIAGCGGSRMNELDAYIDKINQRPPGPLEPLPEIPQVDTFLYDPGDRRDPFVMDDRTAQEALLVQNCGLKPDPLRPKQELEQYSLDSLRMVGTLEQYETRWALVASPDGILHRVKVGDYLGRNNGQITSISPEGIQLAELVSDGQCWREQEASIALKQ